MLIDGRRLLVATHNPGKLREFEYLLAPHGIEVVGAAALGLAEPEETGTTFRANAELKALAAMRDVKLPDTVPPEKKKVMAELGKKSGASFDQAFVKQVGIKDHEDNIKLFESASRDTKDGQLKDWVDKTLPTLKGHLGAAQKLPGATS